MSITTQAGYLIIHLSAEFNFPRDVWQGFLEEFKSEIPPRYREYRADTKDWYVYEPYQRRARELYDKFFRDRNQLSFDVR